MVAIVMGVTASGKTTTGSRLAADVGWPFYDADSFHPPENIARMTRGIPLTDADRKPWLRAIRTRIDQIVAGGGSAVIGCSALKREYRHVLTDGSSGVHFIYLRGDEPLLAERLRHRVGHFMNPRLLASQLETLEEPDDAIAIEIALPLAAQVRRIRGALALMLALIFLGVVTATQASELPPSVTCIVSGDAAGRVYRLRRANDAWSLGLRHKELGDRWLELKLPAAAPIFAPGTARLKYRNANGGRQVDLDVSPDSSSLEVWVDHGLEVNIEPDLDPQVDLMNTEGRLRSLSCRIER